MVKNTPILFESYNLQDLIASILNYGQGAAALRTIELDQRLGGTPVQVRARCYMLVGFAATFIYIGIGGDRSFLSIVLC